MHSSQSLKGEDLLYSIIDVIISEGRFSVSALNHLVTDN